MFVPARIWPQTTAWRATSGTTRTMWPVPETGAAEPRHCWILSATMMMSWASARTTSLRCVSLGTGTRGDKQTQLVWDTSLPLLQEVKGGDKLRAQFRSPREAAGAPRDCPGMRQYVPVGVVLWVVRASATKSLSWLLYICAKDGFGPSQVPV